ncbi:hypothetical protein D3C85_712730 [compost metagenome]
MANEGAGQLLHQADELLLNRRVQLAEGRGEAGGERLPVGNLLLHLVAAHGEPLFTALLQTRLMALLQALQLALFEPLGKAGGSPLGQPLFPGGLTDRLHLFGGDAGGGLLRLLFWRHLVRLLLAIPVRAEPQGIALDLGFDLHLGPAPGFHPGLVRFGSDITPQLVVLVIHLRKTLLACRTKGPTSSHIPLPMA